MAKIIGDLGSEKALVRELKYLGIYSLSNLDDVENHIKNSDSKIQILKVTERNKIREAIEEMKSKHKELVLSRASVRAERLRLLAAERDLLRNRVMELSIPTKNFFLRIILKFRYWKSLRRQRVLESCFDEEVDKPFLKLSKEILELEKCIEYQEINFEKEVLRRISPQISDKENIDKALEQVRNWLIGARGEREVVQTLAQLPDSFIILNDVTLHFKPPLRTEKGLRFQCQADHVVVGPTGVFNIETKYWSQKSIQDRDIRSPVEQIKVTGKGLWRELNQAISNRQIKLNGHHWGDPRINVRNILAMVGAMPNAEFQMVTLLPVNRLPGYLNYFDPVLESDEIESIVDWITVKHSA